MSPKPFAGLRVCIVGVFSVYQSVVRDLIEEAGGTCVDFVDRSTGFLVSGTGSEAGGERSRGHHSKMIAAQQYGVKIISEQMLEEMLRPYAEYDPEAEAQLVAQKLETHQEYGDW